MAASADEHPVVLFDGVCNLCSGAVRFLIEHDEDGVLRFAPLQSDVAATLLADCDVDPERLETIVLVEAGECYTKSTAAVRIARHLDGWLPLLRFLRVVPRPIRDAAYDLVARYRYEVFGQKSACMVPTPDVEARFLARTDR